MSNLTAEAARAVVTGVPAMTDITMRLQPLDDQTLAAMVRSDPAGWAQWAQSIGDTARDLSAIAASLAAMAARISVVAR